MIGCRWNILLVGHVVWPATATATGFATSITPALHLAAACGAFLR